MKGKDLKKIIGMSGLSIEDIVSSSGNSEKNRINKDTLLSLYRENNLEKEVTPKQYNKLYLSVLRPYIDEYLNSSIYNKNKKNNNITSESDVNLRDKLEKANNQIDRLYNTIDGLTIAINQLTTTNAQITETLCRRETKRD